MLLSILSLDPLGPFGGFLFQPGSLQYNTCKGNTGRVWRDPYPGIQLSIKTHAHLSQASRQRS